MDVSLVSRVLWQRRVLRGRERWTRQELVAYQRGQEARLREFAVTRSPFYRHFHEGLELGPQGHNPQHGGRVGGSDRVIWPGQRVDRCAGRPRAPSPHGRGQLGDALAPVMPGSPLSWQVVIVVMLIAGIAVLLTVLGRDGLCPKASGPGPRRGRQYWLGGGRQSEVPGQPAGIAAP